MLTTMRQAVGVFVAVAAALALSAPAPADLIIFTDGLSMEGKVKEVTSDHVVVTVYHGEWGEIVIPRRRVTRIEYDIKSRLEAVPEDDYPGRYKLGKWALEQGLPDEAVKILEPLVGKPGVPDEIHKLLLRIYESQDDLKKALVQAAALIEKNPNDAAARAKVEEFRKELDLKPGEGPGAGAVKPPAGGKTPTPAAGATPLAKPPKAGNTGGDGLEAQRWKREKWGNPCSIQTHDEKGNKMLWIGVAEKAGKSKTSVSLGKRMSFKGRKKLRMSVLNMNDKRSYNLAVAVYTGSGYYESMMKTVRPGWNMDVGFDLTNGKWKTKKTKWQFKSKILAPEDVKKVFLLIYNGARDVSMFFDDIRAE